jgi:hypothetical protein
VLNVDTVEELGRALQRGVYVVASGDVLAEQGLTDTEHFDTQDIVDGADWRAEGGRWCAGGRIVSDRRRVSHRVGGVGRAATKDARRQQRAGERPHRDAIPGRLGP